MDCRQRAEVYSKTVNFKSQCYKPLIKSRLCDCHNDDVVET